MERYWPVPKSYSKMISKNSNAAFKRKDSFIDEKFRKIEIWHSGVDIFCPVGSKVVATEDCDVIRIWKFTGAPDTPEYRTTWAVTVRNHTGNVVVYGELRKPKLKLGQTLKADQTIGYLAQVIFARNEPIAKRRCTLHIEFYKKGTKKTIDWWFRTQRKPKNLLDPAPYLNTCKLIN
jgi:murein DD-endopeptidase MepM/ murein hydrolase activator NlpD